MTGLLILIIVAAVVGGTGQVLTRSVRERADPPGPPGGAGGG